MKYRARASKRASAYLIKITRTYTRTHVRDPKYGKKHKVRKNKQQLTLRGVGHLSK